MGVDEVEHLLVFEDFNLHLLGGVVDRVIPVEGQLLHGEAVRHHSWQQACVDDVAQHIAILFDEVAEDAEVRFRLRQRAAVFNGHRLPDDEFGKLRVGTVDAFVIHVERFVSELPNISFCGLYSARMSI